MFKTTLSRAAAHAERKPLIKFLGKRTVPASVDHTPHVHPASPSSALPGQGSPSFSAYRQHAQQHGPLGRNIRTDSSVGSVPGRDFGPVAAAQGEFFDRSELPARFRRNPYTEAEIEAIETGGATMVC
ncbi:hypothetical protein V497_07400 [Pseudogymnoascus sp. VKM F-4516 (FW-969)]|jgi:small subunit ribosomal protein YMR-31|nr:hypothetical protein V490_07581 [Pseudogymnoascus sp. VKM F-3557]KFY54857.1 hypothetical protein V497_07400 [Pseudogymnoascus sp. VKM F-4516 (FW-969)]